MAQCKYCDGDLPKSGDFVTCFGCNNQYHFGCSLKEATYRRMSEEDKRKWRCFHACKTIRAGGVSGGSTPPPGDGKNPDSDTSEIIKALQSINSKITNVESVVNAIQGSQDFLSSKYDELLSEIKALREDNRRLTNEVSEFKRQIKDKDVIIEELKLQINDIDQYVRTSNLEIHGVEGSSKEDPALILKKIAEKINVDFREEEFNVVHPLPVRNTGRPPTLLIQFTSKTARSNWLSKGKAAKLTNKDLGGDSDKLIYFNENLTPFNRNLLRETKAKAKLLIYRYVWTKQGKIFVRKNDTSQILRIRSLPDLSKIV
jgi:hypothetical protein